jgi:hypothetical protein
MKKIRCISIGHWSDLTINKIYDVISTNDIDQYLIIDDMCNKCHYNSDRFVDATPYIREQKLKQLGI